MVQPASAAEPRWPSGPYRYLAVDQPIPEALVEFGRNLGIQVRVSDAVKGRIGPGIPTGSAREFLEEISKRYGLVWHYDGLVLNVAAESEMTTELIPLDAHAGEDAAGRLERLRVTEERFPTRVLVDDDMLSVSGPPSYIALVKKVLGIAKPPPERGVVNVRVFRGRQAESETMLPQAVQQGGQNDAARSVQSNDRRVNGQ